MFKLQRHKSGPILRPDNNLIWERGGVFNPGIAKVGEEIYMLYRAVGERKAYISHFGLAKSRDGINFTRVSKEPVFGPKEFFDKWATEDPRITKIDNDYYITYVAVAQRIMNNGRSIDRFLPLETSTALLKTRDFLTYKNLGVISPPDSDNKDIVLFPRKINGRYFMLHRPNRWAKEWFNGPYEKYINEGLPCDVKNLPDTPSIWIASSEDLSNWVDHRLLISPSHSSDAKIGPGLPPIETSDGWLVIYHHVKKETELNKPIYSVRVALFDLNDPTRLIAKLPYDILSPETLYETENCSDIVFPTGGFVSKDTLYVYYGASDRYVCLSTGSLKELLSEFKQAAIVEKELTLKIQSSNKIGIVFLATYPPRECGIATFTDDLINNFDQLFATSEKAKVVAMNPDLLQTYDYPKKVILQILENKPADYLAAAKKLNKMPEVELVSIQHEFGIFGADYGKNILIFLAELKKPVAVTFHSVLSNPNAMVKEVVKKIASYADRLIVMTNMSKKLLETVYGVSSEKIKIIPHGLHSIPYTDGSVAKQALGFTGQKVLSTFGLLSRDKGIENAIAALPRLIAADPTIIFLVIGATHPVVLRQEGEVYRNQLIAQAIRLGVSDHVIFYNEYLEIDKLLKFLQATDIYLALSQNPDQAVSGTLTYALGTGRPIISTPFKQAQEIITPEVGVLLAGFQDSAGIGRVVLNLFSKPERLAEMGRTAYFRTRGMTWPNVALAYMREFIEIAPKLAEKEKNLPIIKLGHLSRLTDDFGIYQFAILDQPDPQWGYTLDDNARALIVVCWHEELQGSTITKKLANIYLSFLELASNSQGKFFNYFTTDRQADSRRNQEENLEDSESRTLWALAVASFSKLPAELKKRARALLNRQWDKYGLVTSPRAVAFHIKALAIWQVAEPNKKIITQLTSYADFLLTLFNSDSADDWQWFEQSLSYSNAVLPEALLLAFKATGRKAYRIAGKTALDFLINQSFEGDICVPVGQSGWYLRGGEKKLYDQQPEEVSALVHALRTMYDLSGDAFYLDKMNQAFNWFLGNNLLNQVIYSQFTGGCYDGLGERQINLNQGAESTISYLLARLVIDSKRHN